MKQGRDSTRKRARTRANADRVNAKKTIPPLPLDTKQQDVYSCVFNLEDEMESEISEKMKDRMYTNHTGKFSVRSTRGHQYIMVLINMDSSYISMEPMKNRHSGQMVAT